MKKKSITTKKTLEKSADKSTENKLGEKQAQKIQELEEFCRRTQADFDNFRKRNDQERQERLRLMKADFMVKITPVLDNFKRATENLSEDYTNDPVVQGFLHIQKQLEDILIGEGLEKIPSGGEKFNPAFHEAISYEESNLPVETIIDEVESGWTFSGRVIKPAKVRVSKGK